MKVAFVISMSAFKNPQAVRATLTATPITKQAGGWRSRLWSIRRLRSTWASPLGTFWGWPIGEFPPSILSVVSLVFNVEASAQNCQQKVTKVALRSFRKISRTQTPATASRCSTRRKCLLPRPTWPCCPSTTCWIRSPRGWCLTSLL